MRPFYKRAWTCPLIFIFILLFYTHSFAQTENIKGVKFKDGSIIYGRVIEMNINNIRIETKDGKIISRKFDDVLIFLKDKGDRTRKEVKPAPVAEKILKAEAEIIQPAQEGSEIAGEVLIPVGTELSVVNSETITSKTVVAGTVLKFEVYKDLIVEGVTVIKKGAFVQGYVSDANRARRVGRRGSLSISIESTLTIDNQPIKLRAVNTQEGKDRIVAVLVTGIFVGPFALLRHGTNAVIPKGTIFQVYTDEQKIVHIGDKTSIIKHEIDIKAGDKQDLYTELLKLKELKDKGILTEEEFEVQKKKTLERY